MRTPRIAKEHGALNSAEKARLVSVVEAGLKDVDAGRVYAHADVVREMRARFGGTGGRSRRRG